MRWYVKVIRSGARDADGSLPAEVWKEGVVAPTVNQFDNGDTRSTVIIFQAHQSGEARVQGNTVQTLAAYMGTGGNNMPLASAPTGIRRLTPVECERLQGFPDDWTKYRIDEKKGLIEQADSSRYKQMGNAVAVPCVEWIINRLVEGATSSVVSVSPRSPRADYVSMAFDTQFGSNANVFEGQSPTLKSSQQPPSVLVTPIQNVGELEKKQNGLGIEGESE